MAYPGIKLFKFKFWNLEMCTQVYFRAGYVTPARVWHRAPGPTLYRSFALSISKLYYFLFKCWFTAKIWLKKCFPLTLPLEINILTFSWHFWKKAGNSNLKIKLKKWLTDNRIWKASWYFEFENWDHFWKA